MAFDEADRPRIFLSYGRRDGAEFAARLHAELTGRGFQVWQDRHELRDGRPWDAGVEEGLRAADLVVAVLTPHAVRSDAAGDSVCLDELAFARSARPPKPVVPIMAEPCQPPLMLARLSYVDACGWREQPDLLDAALTRLADAIDDAAAGEAPLRGLPPPWDSRPFLRSKAKDFRGRAWLFEALDRWVAAPEGGPALLIVGDPGAGKSATVAALAVGDPGRRMVAFHSCQAATAATLDPARFVSSLAAMLAERVEGFADALRAVPQAELIEDDAASLFEASVIAPLWRVAPPPGPRLVLIDSLDEALLRDRSGPTILDLLAPRLDRLPPWLRLVATARPQSAITDRLAALPVLRIADDDPRNLEDLAAFIGDRLATPAIAARLSAAGLRPEDVAQALLERSAGNFLYAAQALDGLARNLYDPARLVDLPPGLAGLFDAAFRRLFPDDFRYTPARTVLEVLIAAREALSERQLSAATGLALGAVRGVVDRLGGYLQREGKGLAIFHQALADWLARDTHRFRLDRSAGLERLIDYCGGWRELDDRYPLLHLPAHLAEAGHLDALEALLQDGAFLDRKLQRTGDPLGPVADFRILAAAQLIAGRAEALARALVAGTPAQRSGTTSALAEAGAGSAVVDAAIGMALRQASSRRLGGEQRAAALLAVMRVASVGGRPDALLALAHRAPRPVRLRLVPHLHRLWNDDHDAGWAMMARLVDGAFGAGGWPRAGQIELVAGLSLAIAGSHPDDPTVLRALQGQLRALCGHCRDSPAFRLVGQRWALVPLLTALRLTIAGQAAYQPFNLREIALSMSRPPALRRRALPTIASLADPARGLDAVVALLGDRSLPYDILVMLAAERSLVAQIGRDPAGVMRVLDRLHVEGCPWFHQSLLYVGFHLLDKAEVPPGWFPRYAAMAQTIVEAGHGTFATDIGRYTLVPQMAWLEILAARHEPGRPRYLSRFLDLAVREGDAEFGVRVVRAGQVLSFAYRRHDLALEALAPALDESGALQDSVVETLANIRLHAERSVDRFLADRGREDLALRVRAATPTVGAADIPTWLDEFVCRTLLHSDHFRRELAGAFRRATEVDSAAGLLRQVMPWALNLAAGAPVFAAPSS